eukprot:6925863-Alexandrium_andersonii.AAC.1
MRPRRTARLASSRRQQSRCCVACWPMGREVARASGASVFARRVRRQGAHYGTAARRGTWLRSALRARRPPGG